LGISGFQVYVSGAGWARWLGLDPRWGGGGERISAIRGKRDRVWGSRAAGSETASEFGSRDGEREELDVSSRPLRFQRGEDCSRG